MRDAYWVSPVGEMLPVKSTHIEAVIKNPEVFGITHAYIKEVYKKYRETVGLEGKARDEIVEGLINKRWIRIRYDKSQDYYIVGFKYFDEKQIDYLRKWGMGILALDEKFAAKIVYINDMKDILETCNIEQLASGYLYTKFNTVSENIMNLTKIFKENPKEENLPHNSEMAWEKLFKALDSYSGIFMDLIYSQGGYLKRIGEGLEEDNFKYCSEAVKLSIETIIKCLGIDPDYISNNSFWDIAKQFIHFLTNVNERKILNSIFSDGNLIKFSWKMENIISCYTDDLEDEDRKEVASLHSDLCESLTKLRGLFIVYDRLNPAKKVFAAKEAIKKWSESDQNFKKSVIEEWEDIKIPNWKKYPDYFTKIYQ